MGIGYNSLKDLAFSSSSSSSGSLANLFGSKSTDGKGKFSIMIGGAHEYRFNKSKSIYSQLFLISKDFTIENSGGDITSKCYYLEIPILFKLSAVASDYYETRVYLALGPQISFPLSYSTDIPDSYPSTQKEKLKDIYKPNSTDFGGVILVGVNHNKYIFEARYDLVFTESLKNFGDEVENENYLFNFTNILDARDYHYQSIHFMVGYTF